MGRGRRGQEVPLPTDDLLSNLRECSRVLYMVALSFHTPLFDRQGIPGRQSLPANLHGFSYSLTT